MMNILVLFLLFIFSTVKPNISSLITDTGLRNCQDGEIQGEGGSRCCPEVLNQKYTSWSCIDFMSLCMGLCKPGTSFPHGGTFTNIHCKNGEWMTNDKPYTGETCQKSGEHTKDKPEVSTKPNSFGGFGHPERTCQRPEDPENARIFCRDDKNCIVECLNDRHAWWNGNSIIHLTCDETNNVWKIREAPSIVFQKLRPGCIETRTSNHGGKGNPPPLTQITTEKPTVSEKCRGIPVKESETIGMLRKGNCSNKHPISNFINCKGSCHSYVNYDGRNRGIYSSKCQCCQASDFSAHNIRLSCKDGGYTRMQYFKPTSCTCGPCIESFIPKTTAAPPWRPPKPGCPEGECD